MENIRPYRVIMHNVNPTEEKIKNTLESEIKDAELIDFEIEATYNYEAPITSGGDGRLAMFPQRDIIIKLNYKKF